MDGDWWPPGATVSAHLGRFASPLEDGSCALLLPIFHDLFTTTSGQGRGTRAVEYRREHGVVKGPARPGKRDVLQRLSGQKLYPVIEFENGSIHREESNV